jgi:tetratricopeptide (TPR) repeat protein
MELSKKFWISIGAGAVIVLTTLFFSLREKQDEPSIEIPVAEEDGAPIVDQETIIKPQAQTKPAPAFLVNSKDTISSWSFSGIYAGNESLTIRAQTDIARLQSLLGTGEYQDYDLYNGIGNNYTYLGDGERAFVAYKKAISLDPSRAIVYMNVGNLMEQLDAMYSAKDAYAKAVESEPNTAQYKNAERDFLTHYFPEEGTQN